MKVLASATLVLTSLVVSIPALAERPDFSKTAAAQSDYHFADNPSVNHSYQLKRSTRHDFSKTTAANSQYSFSDNPASSHCLNPTFSSQHDFSKTKAVRTAS
ncbi:hypothetical protein [Shewanella sp. Isolate11]|uniref:hypothetical protein n=1 Tax=Shewanella sp. Isolate11 TaxID=2908530 RepID=UPI001EFEAF05|nr:hypothetical protein [Shewanella sp. Isolate11]MCG9695544.1 hypothetical protein [Shewanella sp. Isolate11]